MTETTAQPTATARLGPVAAKDRIFTLDMLRGWAILGILAVNAVTFAWPFAIEADPTLPHPWPENWGNTVGAWVETVFFQDKFRSLFSMLFGVSVFLIGGERDDEDRGRLLRRRLFWLALFGLAHGLALWYGDILLHYAYTGLLMLLMRSMSAGKLIGWGLGINLVAGLLSAAAMMMQAMAPPEAAGSNPFAVTPEDIQAIIAAYQGSFPGAHAENFKSWVFLQGFSLFLMPITLGLMMLGLGLFKSGFLVGRSPTWVYLAVFALGAANLGIYGWYEWLDVNAEGDPSGGLSGVAGSFAWVITLGYVSMLILMTRFGLRFLTARLAPVGRMAFTNYLTQTLIMTSLFYMPWGPHWFGQAEWGPAGLWTAVGAIWLAQLIWSPLWLAVFSMGPFEWLWRCMTYRRLLPIRREAAA